VAAACVNEHLFTGDESATPISAEELEGLIPRHITLRSELNEFEQRGVVAGTRWAFGRRRRDLLTPRFVITLHRQMFRDVWRWAGTCRSTQKNIGVAPEQIQTQLKLALDDARYWIDNQTFSADEIGVRLHHRLVWIHPFANGNGRHARLMADLLVVQLGGARFSWGGADPLSQGDPRKAYIGALKAADKDRNDITALLKFARS
jgi:Fic-DOC domain mobile mystery protein B